ncbi:MAG: hypothetical protein IT431_06660 [Phycisphaerales bacterium]|nr:hypothetical protein [Phycisphaerales bacterium]
MTRFVRTTRLLVLTLGAACGAARGQDDARFREVEPGFEDTGQGLVSTLLRPVDLRVPTDFSRVYEVVGTGKFARRAGAVTAVFDRSVYARDGSPAIPAGTVFYIGTLPVDLGSPGLLGAGARWVSAGSSERVGALATPAAVVDARMATKVDLRVGSGTPPPPALADPDATIWTSERYRQRRMGELLRGVAWRVRGLDAVADDPGEGRRD